MGRHDRPDGLQGPPPSPRDLPPDEALSRLEDVLLGLPYDRALPDLHTILAAAGVTEDFLRTDDRAAKVLHEAIVARPLSSAEVVSRRQTEVELLTLEVDVLTERLEDRSVGAAVRERAKRRLAEIRRRLEEIRDDL